MTNKLSTKLEYVYHLYLNIMTKIVKYRIGKWILCITYMGQKLQAVFKYHDKLVKYRIGKWILRIAVIYFLVHAMSNNMAISTEKQLLIAAGARKTFGLILSS